MKTVHISYLAYTFVFLVVLAVIMPTISLAQNEQVVEESDTAVTPELLDELAPDRARNAELRAKFEAGTITDAELTEYAELNSGDRELWQYLETPANTQTAATEDDGEENPVAVSDVDSTDISFASGAAVDTLSSRLDGQSNVLTVLAVVVFFNLLLSLYIMFRKRRV